MKDRISKIMLCFLAVSLVMISGCGGKEEVKEQEEKLTLVNNAVYTAPTNPTNPQIKVYNELSDAMNNNAAPEKVAELVAVNFAYEFFSLYQKTGKEDIGGLTFLPQDEVENFKSYAMLHYYNNYATVVSQYGEEDLPNVMMHEVTAVESTQIAYNQLVYDGYVVSLTLKYADSKLPADGLKTTMHVQVCNIDGVYRVIALED